RNVTIANNRATGSGGLAPQGGGISGSGFDLANTLLGGNAVGSGGSGPDCFARATGFIVSSGFNLIQNVADCHFGTDATTITGLDPHLGPLADNGGLTQTHLLLTGSPALNTGNFAPPGTGNTTCSLIDQRTVARPQNGRCDIGSVEV